MNAVIRPLWFRVRGAAVRTIGYDRIVRMFMNPARLAGEPQCLVDFVFGDRHVALAPCRIRRLPLFFAGKEPLAVAVRRRNMDWPCALSCPVEFDAETSTRGRSFSFFVGKAVETKLSGIPEGGL